MNTSTAPYRHWSREPWPWILMALPASAVVAGMITLWLAIRSDDSLVVDDYYKEGKAINQRIARDARASELGLAASVIQRAGQLDVTLAGRLVAPVAALQARFVHVAKSDYDHTLLVLAGPGGHLVGEMPKLVPGRYRLHLAPPGGDWRLVSEVFEAGDSIGRLEIRSGAIARYRIEAKP